VGVNDTPTGHLSVTAPTLFGQKYVMPSILAYLQTYPDTQVDAVFLDRVVNLLEEGFDVGVRIGELPDSTLRARRVGTVRMVLVAAPGYLVQAGIPQSPQALASHTLIASSASSLTQDWQFVELGQKKALRIQPRLTVTTNLAAIDAARAGFGIARLISYQVADELVRGELKIVLENYEPSAMPIHILHRENRFSSNKIRSFIDLLAQRLLNDKAIN
jgi:DNA-binding transcriptional LysR family regulator